MLRVIVSGGGTGGHIYPAVSVAGELKKRLGDDVEILFVGAQGKMEMDIVPRQGYKIEGLPVAGLQRKMSAKNLLLPFKVLGSVVKARRIIRRFKADIVVGFGGYASAPVLWAAQMMGRPTIIQEQNSYAGVTNKILGKRAKQICVAYDGMERYFPANRIVMTGNPLRGSFSGLDDRRDEAFKYFGLDPKKKVIAILGGSLGTRTLNNMMKKWVDTITAEGKVQVIWQNGKIYDAEMAEFMTTRSTNGLWRAAFVDRMDLLYSAADIIITRSGASTVSELCLVGKPVLFVPSPNVAEDHQTKNAMALVEKGAAEMVHDRDAVEKAIPVALEILADERRATALSENIKKLAIPDSAARIVKQILDVCSYKNIN